MSGAIYIPVSGGVVVAILVIGGLLWIFELAGKPKKRAARRADVEAAKRALYEKPAADDPDAE